LQGLYSFISLVVRPGKATRYRVDYPKKGYIKDLQKDVEKRVCINAKSCFA